MAKFKTGLTIMTLSYYFLTISLPGSISIVTGAVVISPSPKAEVCRVGDSLEVTCSITNSTISSLQWNLDFTSETGMNTQLSAIISLNTVRDQTHVLGSRIIFIFSRSSELGRLPIASTLVISPIKESVNGTRINCREGLSGNTAMLASTTVFLVGDNPEYYHPRTPVVKVDEYFGTQRVTLSMWWTITDNALVTYNTYVTPSNGVSMITSDARANVTVPYNTLYVVSVVASFCGQNNARADIELYYVKCGNPFNNVIDNTTLEVTELENPALVGSSVNFTCVNGLVLTGPNAAICMSNGEWEPDPREVNCKGSHNATKIRKDQETNISDICTHTSGLSLDVKIAVGSSVTVFVLSAVLFFTIGFVSGHFCHKQKQSADHETVPPLQTITTPLYDDIQLPNNITNKQEIEMNFQTNIAYGPCGVKL